jgi:hypothetical protein
VTDVELLVLVALTLGVVGLAGRLPEARRVKRELGRYRPQPFASLAEGRVITLYGRVSGGELLRAPLTDRMCVYWRLVFEEVGTGGDARELGRVEQSGPFALHGSDGAVHVVPGTPLLAVPAESIVRPTGDLYVRTDTVSRIAQEHCRRINYMGSSLLRITEYVIAPDMEVMVRGYCTREPDPDAAQDVEANYRGDTPMRFVISGTRRARVRIG